MRQERAGLVLRVERRRAQRAARARGEQPRSAIATQQCPDPDRSCALSHELAVEHVQPALLGGRPRISAPAARTRRAPRGRSAAGPGHDQLVAGPGDRAARARGRARAAPGARLREAHAQDAALGEALRELALP